MSHIRKRYRTACHGIMTTHGEDDEDEVTVRALIEAAEDPEEALKQRLHCGVAYVEDIIDD